MTMMAREEGTKPDAARIKTGQWRRRSLLAVWFVVINGCASCPATETADPELAPNLADTASVAAVDIGPETVSEITAEATIKALAPTSGAASPPASPAELLSLGPWLDLPVLVAAVRELRDGRSQQALTAFKAWLEANPTDSRGAAVRVWVDATALAILGGAMTSTSVATLPDARETADSLSRSAEAFPLLAADFHLDAVRALLLAGEAADALARLETFVQAPEKRVAAEAADLALKARLALGHVTEVVDSLQKQAKEAPGSMSADAVETLMKLEPKAVTTAVRSEFVRRFSSDARVIAVMDGWDLRELKFETRLELAEKLLDSGRYQLTRQMVGKVGDGPAWKGAVACRAGLLHGFSIERTTNRKNRKGQDRVYAFFSKLVRDCQGEVGAWATFIAGRNRVRLIGREKNVKKRQKLEREAHAMLTEHVRDHGDRSTVDDALQMLADLEADPKKAEMLRLDALARHPDGDMAEALAWALVGGSVQRGDWPAVLAHITAVFERVPNGPRSRHGGRFAYWRARALAATGDAVAAATMYREIVRDHAFSWYAVLGLSQLCQGDEACALRELEAIATQMNPPAATGKSSGSAMNSNAGAAAVVGGDMVAGPETLQPPEVNAPSPFATLWADVDFRRAVEWARIASHAHSDEALFFNRVHDALEAVPKAVRPAGDAWFEARAAVFHLAGAWARATGEARSLEARAGLAFPIPDKVGLWQAAYPRPFHEEVQRFADLRGIPAAWVWAIGRVESNFNPQAVSWANAIGLMQIIPPTAQSLARGTTIDPTPENLKKPEVSIELATRYLAKLLGQHGQIPLASAGYNAGGGAVSRWRREFGELEVDRFVENIPYSEAHNYAKSVTQAAARYAWLYQQKPLLLQVKGPAADSVIPAAGADVDFAAPAEGGATAIEGQTPLGGADEGASVIEP